MWGISRYRAWGRSRTGSVCIVGAICAFLFSLSATADERVLRFQSDITVRDDGAVDVVETLTVRCEQRSIQHGIFRDLPSRNANGKPLSITISEIRRDGAVEPYTRKTQGADLRYYIGDPKTTVPSGEHTYRIAYQAKLPVRVSMGHAELNWSVTGNAWDFPIDAVTATVKLPNATDASGLQLAARTGARGATGADYTSQATNEGTATFTTTRGLRAHEGFAITLGFPAVVASRIPVEAEAPPLPAEAPPHAVPLVTQQAPRVPTPAPVRPIRVPPPPQTPPENPRADVDVFLAIAGLVGALIFYFVALRLNAKPRRESVAPADRPPHNLSPAVVRYVLAGRCDETTFIAALVSMAAKGFLRIKEDDGAYSLECASGDRGVLSDDEALIAKELLLGLPGDEVKLKPAFSGRFASARSRLGWHMRWRYRRAFFTTNASLWLYGFGFSIFMLGVSVLNLKLDNSVLPGWVGASIGLIAAVHAGMAIVFWFLLKKPTPRGRQALDQIEAYRRYLENKIASLPPEVVAAATGGLGPESLAYAVALGMDNVNTARLTKLLRAPNGDPSANQSLEDWTWMPELWHGDSSLFAWHLSHGMPRALTHSWVPELHNTALDTTSSNNNWPDFGGGSSGGGFFDGGSSGGFSGGGDAGGGFSGGGDSGGGGGGW